MKIYEIEDMNIQIIKNEIFLKCSTEIRDNEEYDYTNTNEKELIKRMFNNALENLYEYNNDIVYTHNNVEDSVCDYSSMDWCVAVASENLLEDLRNEIEE